MTTLILWCIWMGCTAMIGRAEYGRGYLSRSIEIGRKKIEWLEKGNHTESDYKVFEELEDWGDEKKSYWSNHFVWLQKVIKKYTGYEKKLG